MYYILRSSTAVFLNIESQTSVPFECAVPPVAKFEKQAKNFLLKKAPTSGVTVSWLDFLKPLDDFAIFFIFPKIKNPDLYSG